MKSYDVIIVGASPGGIFCALELSKHPDIRVLMIDKGRDIPFRVDSAHDLTSGWGGSGAFSDGKLVYSPDIGGRLKQLLGLEQVNRLSQEVDEVYLEYGASRRTYGTDTARVNEMKEYFARVGIRLVPSITRHLGTDECRIILQKMRETLEPKIDILMTTEVTGIICENGRVKGVETKNGDVFQSHFVVLSVGRSGAQWLARQSRLLNLAVDTNPADIGVRIEVAENVLHQMAEVLYEPKLIWETPDFNDKVRTFCVCPRGFVVKEQVDDVTLVNGHSFANKKSENTNFAMLVSLDLPNSLTDNNLYSRKVASAANLLYGGVIVQRWGDLIAHKSTSEASIGRNSVIPTLNDARPGDLTLVLPYRVLKGVIGAVERLGVAIKGLAEEDTLLYGVETKFYSFRIRLNRDLETNVKNLFAIGDGAGITRGLVQASASGLFVVRKILERRGSSLT